MKRDSKYFDKKVELSLRISKDFKNVYDLGYALVDLQALITSCNYVFFEGKGYKSLPVTSRKFAARYQNELSIRDFRKGSFWIDLGVSVLSGTILLFIAKYLIQTAQSKNNNVTINITININHNSSLPVNTEDNVLHQEMKLIVDGSEIIPDNPNQSTINLISAINNSGVLGEEKIPIDETGIKTISGSIERFSKSIE